MPRLFFRRPASVRIKWEPKDLWVGVFWDQRPSGNHLYICPLPTLLIHILFADARPVVGAQYMNSDREELHVLRTGWTKVWFCRAGSAEGEAWSLKEEVQELEDFLTTCSPV